MKRFILIFLLIQLFGVVIYSQNCTLEQYSAFMAKAEEYRLSGDYTKSLEYLSLAKCRPEKEGEVKNKISQLIKDIERVANQAEIAKSKAMENELKARQAESKARIELLEQELKLLKVQIIESESALTAVSDSWFELIESNFKPKIPGGFISMPISKKFLKTANYLKDVENRIKDILNKGGYSNNRSFSVNGGFAIATDVEAITNDRVPKYGPERFLKPADLSKSEGNWLEKWWYGRKNASRMFLFVVSTLPFDGKGEKLSYDEIKEWLEAGTNKIPDTLGDDLFTEKHSVDVLVYEYVITEVESNGKPSPSKFTVEEHLKKAKLMAGVNRNEINFNLGKKRLSIAWFILSAIIFLIFVGGPFLANLKINLPKRGIGFCPQ